MANSTIPELELDGRNWKAYRTSLLEAAAMKGWLGILSGQESSDETLRWEGRDAQVKMLLYQTVPVPLVLKFRRLKTSREMFDYLATTFRDPTQISIPIEKPIEASSDDETREPFAKPSELSVEPPMRERLENGLTEARSEDEAEAAVGEAQQVSSRSVEVEENIPEVPSELQEQLSSRAVEPLESEHMEVLTRIVEVEKLDGIVEKPYEVEDVDRKAMRCERSTDQWRESAIVHIRDVPDNLPTPRPDTPPSIKFEGEWTKDPSFDVEPTSSGNTNNLPSARGLPLEGEQALCTSGSPRSSNSIEDEQPSIGKADTPNLTVYDPGGTLRQPMVHSREAEMDEGGCRVLLEGEQTRSTSSNETNPRGHVDTSSPLSICTGRLSEPTTTWRQVGMGDINVTTPRNEPVEAPSTPHQEITFVQPTSPDEEPTARDVEDGITGGHSEPRASKDDMTSSGNVNSERVEAEILARESQDAYRGQNVQADLPVSSRPPTRLQKCFREVPRPKCRRGRTKFEARNVSRRREDEEGYQSCDNAISHAREGIGTPRNLTIKPWTPQEGPEDIRNWLSVNTNLPSQIRGPGGQDAANEAFGDVEGEPKLQNNGKRVEMDGRKCRMDGTTSSMRCDSKRVKTKLLAENEAGQHQRQQHKPRNVPGPPTRLRKHTYELTKPRRRRGRIKTKSRKVSRPQEGENMYQERANAIAHPREGIGTPQSLTTVSGTLGECQRHVRDVAEVVQALRSTKMRRAGHEHDATYQIRKLRSHALQTAALEAREREKSIPLYYETEKRDSKSTETLHATYRSYVQISRTKNAKTKSLEPVEGDLHAKLTREPRARRDFQIGQLRSCTRSVAPQSRGRVQPWTTVHI